MTDLLISIIALALMLVWGWLHVWLGSQSKHRWALITCTFEIFAFSALVFLINWQVKSSIDKSGMMAGGAILILAFFVLVIPALLSLVSLWWHRI